MTRHFCWFAPLCFVSVLNACTGSPTSPNDSVHSPSDSPSNGGSGGSDGKATGGSHNGGSGGDTSNVAGSSNTTPSSFATHVISYQIGKNGGFGEDQMPDIVLGPPQGAGDLKGSLDTLSLGLQGEIILSFDQDIVDGEGPDFIVFENAFFAGGDPEHPWVDPGEVSVSEDGQTWTTFTCDPEKIDQTYCAGQNPVYSSTLSGIDPLDIDHCGGDVFDLSIIQVPKAKYVRIRDKSPFSPSNTAGFDLDAVVIIHGSAK